MAYDRYDRDYGEARHRGERERDRYGPRGRDERGFFERAGDEIASWFGDEEAERRRTHDLRTRERGHGRERDEERFRARPDYERERGFRREGDRSYLPMGWTVSDRDYERGYDPEFDRPQGSLRERDFGRRDYGRTSEWERDPYRRTSFAGSTVRSNYEDHPYDEWRRQHVADLDRDYDEYRREHQERFESDFGSWRERREGKRRLLGRVREHMEVVGSDEKHVGTVDRIAGDRIILTKSDPESGGHHHSISCAMVDRIDGDRVVLELDADKARERWRDDERQRALFEREDQGEIGPGMLNRSFSGTYR
jgi:hypothetical protein